VPRGGPHRDDADHQPQPAPDVVPGPLAHHPAGIGIGQRVVEHVGVGVPALRVGRLLDHRVRLQEPPQLRVVDATVHVDDLCAIHHFMAGETARRQRRSGTDTRGIAIRPPVTEGRVVQRLGHRTVRVGDAHQITQVIVESSALVVRTRPLSGRGNR
jgi:hypothetical protein